MLKTELFGPSNSANSNIDSTLDTSFLTNSPSSNSRYAAGTTAVTTAPTPTSPTRNLFSFRSPARKRTATGLDSPTHERYSVSPVRYESQKLLLSPRKTPRSLSKVPFKVLDAPELAVSFQLHLVLSGVSLIIVCRTTFISISSIGLRPTCLLSVSALVSISGRHSRARLPNFVT